MLDHSSKTSSLLLASRPTRSERIDVTGELGRADTWIAAAGPVSKPRIAATRKASAVVHDQDRAVGTVCDPLAHASKSTDAVQAARADDDEVRLA